MKESECPHTKMLVEEIHNMTCGNPKDQMVCCDFDNNAGEFLENAMENFSEF